jgi:hypothetical protein
MSVEGSGTIAKFNQQSESEVGQVSLVEGSAEEILLVSGGDLDQANRFLTSAINCLPHPVKTAKRSLQARGYLPEKVAQFRGPLDVKAGDTGVERVGDSVIAFQVAARAVLKAPPVPGMVVAGKGVDLWDRFEDRLEIYGLRITKRSDPVMIEQTELVKAA